MQRVFFDRLNSGAVRPEVLEAMRPFFTECPAAPSGLHAEGLRARAAVEEAREEARRFVNASEAGEIIFTSGGTEALNLAVQGAALARQRRGRHLVLSAIEHPAVAQPAAFLATQGFLITTLPVDAAGRIDGAQLAAALREDTALVALHAAHHDLGTIQSLGDIGELLAESGVPFFVDATHAAGWIALNVRQLQASYLALAPHRLGGPKGIGILYRQSRAGLTPLLRGGVQENGWRAGLENVPAIVGAGVAMRWAAAAMPTRVPAVRALQERLWKSLSEKIPGLHLNGPLPGPERLPNQLHLSARGVEGEGLALSLDLKGFAIGAGSACLTKASKIPPVLAALGLDPALALGTVLLSFDESNTAEEADRLATALAAAVEHLRAMSPSW